MNKHKQLLIFNKTGASSSTNNKFVFKFARAIIINSFRLKKYVAEDIGMKVFLHCPELSQRMKNNTVLNSDVSDIIAFLDTDSKQFEDKFSMLDRMNLSFDKLSFYFSDGLGNILNPTDFILVFDVKKNTNII